MRQGQSRMSDGIWLVTGGKSVGRRGEVDGATKGEGNSSAGK